MELQKFLDTNPTQISEVVNQLGQKIDIYDDIMGMDGPVWAACPDTGEAFRTDFFDQYDFEEDSEYNPIFLDGEMRCYYEVKEKVCEILKQQSCK